MHQNDLNRRQMLQFTAAGVMSGASLSILPVTAHAALAKYEFTLGDAKITVVSDGYLNIPTTALGLNRPREEVVAVLKANGMDPDKSQGQLNIPHIALGGASVVLDVGAGSNFQDSAGKLAENLDAAGIDRAAVTHVAMTHAHADHIWGLWDDFEGAPRMAKAVHALSATEYDHWMAKDLFDKTPPAAQAFVVGAQNAIKRAGEGVKRFTDGESIAPGITAMLTPGHTPGHTAFRIESGGESLIVTGDVLIHPIASFQYPDWHGGFDLDKERAVKTRKRLLDMAATDKIPVLCYHLPFPGVGMVEKKDGAYRFVTR